LFGVGFFFIVVIPLARPVFTLQIVRRERRFRNRMKARGRFITVKEVRPRLDAGGGNLILECGLKGTYRIWWTEDDLRSLGPPIATREELVAFARGQEHVFNTRCQKEFLDEETGRAILTSIPARWDRSRKLAQMFPQIKTVTVYHLAFVANESSVGER
jgi:hypothetical protein